MCKGLVRYFRLLVLGRLKELPKEVLSMLARECGIVDFLFCLLPIVASLAIHDRVFLARTDIRYCCPLTGRSSAVVAGVVIRRRAFAKDDSGQSKESFSQICEGFFDGG